ncbi:hypothetical protein L873DRAFT_1816701 [Choiromyces venosus 120613-1]|uniref:Uncharacterized protein n=1 Tax=Choiromyces venosus 120613-1 TaxID=1336337 RepID=A0A3N4J454_9PEZI|nr:hypothetical protein L873DRAFT_1816701 [Choiromyces venosus 120613-1]
MHNRGIHGYDITAKRETANKYYSPERNSKIPECELMTLLHFNLQRITSIQGLILAYILSPLRPLHCTHLPVNEKAKNKKWYQNSLINIHLPPTTHPSIHPTIKPLPQSLQSCHSSSYSIPFLFQTTQVKEKKKTRNEKKKEIGIKLRRRKCKHMLRKE